MTFFISWLLLKPIIFVISISTGQEPRCSLTGSSGSIFLTKVLVRCPLELLPFEELSGRGSSRLTVKVVGRIHFLPGELVKRPLGSCSHGPLQEAAHHVAFCFIGTKMRANRRPSETQVRIFYKLISEVPP